MFTSGWRVDIFKSQDGFSPLVGKGNFGVIGTAGRISGRNVNAGSSRSQLRNTADSQGHGKGERAICRPLVADGVRHVHGNYIHSGIGEVVRFINNSTFSVGRSGEIPLDKATIYILCRTKRKAAAAERTPEGRRPDRRRDGLPACPRRG